MSTQEGYLTVNDYMKRGDAIGRYLRTGRGFRDVHDCECLFAVRVDVIVNNNQRFSCFGVLRCII